MNSPRPTTTRQPGQALRCGQDASPERHSVSSTRPFLPFLLVLVVGSGLSVAAFLVLKRQAHEAVLREVRAAAEERLELLGNAAQSSLEVLHGLTAFLQVSQPSRPEFRRFVGPSLRRLPQVQALEWIPRVTLGERERFEASAREDGIVGFRFTQIDGAGGLAPAAERAEYFPVYYAEPPHPNRPALGLDLASDPTRGAALSRAAATGAIAATAPVRLAQEQHSGQLGYLVFSPVRDGRGSLVGFALAVFRVESLAQPAFESLPAGDFEVALFDVTDGELPLARFGSTSSDARQDVAHRSSLEIAGRRLALTFTPSAAFMARHAPGALWGYPMCIGGLTLALATHLLRRSLREREIEAKVAERTAALTREIAARRQIELLLRGAEAKYRTIFENSAAGIFQMRLDGRYLSANPALCRLFGYESPDALMADAAIERRYVRPRRRQRFFQLLERDGRVLDFVSECVRLDGKRIWIAESVRRVAPDDGAARYEGSVQEVTERVEAQRTLRRNKAWLEEQVRERTLELSHANERLSAEITIRRDAQRQAARAHQANPGSSPA
jgi:PAS domain S-box-containing protein